MLYAPVLVDRYVSVEHLAPDSGNANEEGYVVDLSLAGVPCNIQPTSPQMIELYGGAYGKAHTLYTTSSGILETDRLTVSGTGRTFIVKGKQIFDYQVGMHSEYYLEEVQP